MSSSLQAKPHKKVSCLFCGIRTEVPAHADLRSVDAAELDGYVSIVRCHSCGKEAVYRSIEIMEFQERPRDKSAAAGA